MRWLERVSAEHGQPKRRGTTRQAVVIVEMRLWIALTRHVVLLWRSGLLRFRLETFGTYYPEFPYRSPAWRVSPAYFTLLLRRAHSYGLWLLQMDDICRHGAQSWSGLHSPMQEGLSDE